MAWQLDVSYRGAAFFVDGTDDEGFVQRGVHHQFPRRDKGVWEPLGQDDPVYNLSGYVTELSPGGYAAARDKLIAACTAGGLGDLVHPYFGTKKVQCTACRVTHNDKENGVARFTLSFIEADEPHPPAIVNDSAAKINDAADAALDSALNDFAGNWSLSGAPGFVQDAATDAVQNVADAFTDLAGPLPGAINDMDKFASGTAKLLGVGAETLDNPAYYFAKLANNLTAGTFGDAMSLARNIAGLGRMLSLLSGNEKDAYKTQQSFSSVGQDWPSVPEYTANRRIQANNQKALQDLIARAAVIDAARMTPYMPLESREEAVAVRDSLIEQIDALAENATDELYRRLEALRAAVVADLTSRGPELGRIGSYTPKATRPALVIAYKVYQNIGADAERATELAARNSLKHPGFVPGGVALEVKLDA